MSANASDVIKTLRSLLNSTQNGLNANQLMREFREMEGYAVPFQQLGFSTFVQFLQNSNEFEIQNTPNGPHIRAKLTKESVHIAKLVSSQNRGKRKKNVKPIPFAPRRNVQSNNNWRNTAFAKVNAQEQANRILQQKVQMQSVMIQNMINTMQRTGNPMPLYPNVSNANNFQFQKNNAQMPSVRNAPILALPPVAPVTSSMASVVFPSTVQKPIVAPAKMSSQNVSSVSNVTPVMASSTSNNMQPNVLAPTKLPPSQMPSIIDLTKSTSSLSLSSPQPVKNKTLSSNDDRWEHDKWDPVPPVAQKNNNHSRSSDVNKSSQMPQLIKSNLISTSQIGLNKSNTNMTKARSKNASKENLNSVSSAWLSSKDAAKTSVFERLGLNLKTKAKGKEPMQSVQSRLNVNQTHESATSPSDTVDNASTTPMAAQKIISQIELQMPKEKTGEPDPKQTLAEYCKKRGFSSPKYSTVPTKSKKFEGIVQVEGMTYSTQPFDYSKECDAHNDAALLALKNMKDFSISSESPDLIADKILKCISESGTIMKYLPNIFEQNYSKSLPNEWEDIIQNRPEMFEVVRQPTMVGNIVFKRTATENVSSVETKQHSVTSTPTRISLPKPSPTMKKQDSTTSTPKEHKNSIFELPKLTLPWNETTWRVDITWMNSTADIWCTLCDLTYLDELHAKLEAIEENGDQLQPCRNVQVGGIYLTAHNEPTEDGLCTFRVYRVKVKSIDDIQKKALCLYIDDGFEELLSFDLVDSDDNTELKLFCIPNEVCEIPAQAINFSLYNLEDFEENPHAIEEAEKILLNHEFLLKPKTTKEEHEHDDKLSVMLYDFIPGGDVLLVNKLILEKICDRFQRPELDKRHNLVYVTHVSDTADIYCQLYKSKDVQTIKQIIKRLTVNGIHEKNRISASELMDITSKTLCLVFDTSKNRWYRAEILSSHPSDGIIVKCRFVDYGYTKFVSLEHIYKLNSPALKRYPSQTITVRLNDFLQREFTPKVVERLKVTLFGHKPLCYVQPIKLDDIPKVNIVKRIENVLCKINDSLRIELEMENSPDFVPLPDDDDDDDSFSLEEKVLKNSSDLPDHQKPKCGEIYKVRVITAVNPSYFFIRLSSDLNDYETMMHSLWKCCEHSQGTIEKNQIQTNEFYAGRLKDGYWHRVKVQSILSNEVVVILKWDSGDIDQLSIDALRPLPSCYREIRQMVLPARLHGIKPIQNVWTKDDSAHFHELAVGNEFKAEIMDVKMEADKKFITELILLTPRNLNISEQMIREQRAVHS